MRMERFDYQGTVDTKYVSLVKNESESKEFRFRMLALTSDYMEDEALKKWHPTLVNKEFRWRHNKLEDKPEAFLGVVEGTEIGTVKNEKDQDVTGLFADVVIFGETDEQEEAIQLVRESIEKGNPIGDSVGYIKITDEPSNRLVRAFFRELSMTPYPKCTVCKATEIYNEKDKNNVEEIEMPNEVSTEKLESIVKSYNTTLEARVNQLEDEKKTLQKEVVTKDVAMKEMERRVIGARIDYQKFEHEVNDLKAKNVVLEDKNRKLTTIPQRIRLAQMEGLDKPEAIQERIRELENDTLEQLNDKIQSIRSFAKRMEIRKRAQSSAKIGSEQNAKAGSTSYEDEIANSTPEQLAAKYYGV